MPLYEGRRLTGRTLWTEGPGVGAELSLDEGEDPSRAIGLLREEVARVFTTLGLGEDRLRVHVHRRGLSLAAPAPIDGLYAAVEAFEHAVERAMARAEGRALEPDDARLRELADALAEERNPRFLALLEAAHEHDVPLLWDDEELSLGLGSRSRTFGMRALPSPDEVEWSALGRVPVAMVTGTNGKTTTTRMLARMLDAAGLVPGLTSTDGLVVGGELVDDGDWSGPGGARALLRHPKVEAAVLETARGGLLRRGLALERCDVAVVTNVGEDHFGEYGVLDRERMADVKLLVAHALGDEGTLVLNADDGLLLEKARTLSLEAAPRRVLFSRYATERARVVVKAHLDEGGVAWFLDGTALVRARGDERQRLCDVGEVPLAFGGAARHNVENALAAAAAGDALGLPWDALAQGLRSLRPTPKDSPGRSNVLEKGGVRLLLDFAHNPEGAAVTLELLAALRARDESRGRLFVLVGQAGDRSEEDVRAFAKSVLEGGADIVIARELKGYLRGRAAGETPALFREALARLGHPRDAVWLAEDDVQALSLALEHAKPGDTVALLVQVDAQGVHALLESRGWALEG